jgi:hypothetical protein
MNVTVMFCTVEQESNFPLCILPLRFLLITMFKCGGDFRRQLAPACGGATTEEEEGNRQAHQTEC